MQVRNIRTKVDTVPTLVIPFLCSIIVVIHHICNYFDYDARIFSELSGTGVLMWVFMLISSYEHKLCLYNRMFIYYLIFVNVLGSVDYYLKLNIDAVTFNVTICIAFGISVIFYGYLKYLDNKKSK